MSSLLESLKPIKPVTSVSIDLYKEDFEIFNTVLEILKNESKGSSEINEAVLFEHLTAQLRADKDLMKKVAEKPVRRKRRRSETRKSKASNTKTNQKPSEIVQ